MQSTTAEVFNTLDDTASKSEQWIEKNSKPLFYGLVVVIVLILGLLAILLAIAYHFVKMPVKPIIQTVVKTEYIDKPIYKEIEVIKYKYIFNLESRIVDLDR